MTRERQVSASWKPATPSRKALHVRKQRLDRAPARERRPCAVPYSPVAGAPRAALVRRSCFFAGPMPTRTELVWDGKYDADGKRVAPLRVPLPFQTVETINETAQ